MAVKLPDTLVPMADFPSAFAKDVQFTDGENLQDKLDNGKLGSSSSGTGLNIKTYTNITQLGLTAPVITGKIYNALPENSIFQCEIVDNKTVSDTPENTGILTIQKSSKRLAIEFKACARYSVYPNNLYLGQLKGDDGSGITWNKVALSSDIEGCVTDIELSSKGYATETFVTNKIAEASLSGSGVDLSGYATKDDVPTKTSELTNDSGFITSIPSEYITETELETKGYLTEHQDISDLALKSEIPDVSSFITSDDLPTVPTKVSDLENDSNFVTNSKMLEAIANAQLGNGEGSDMADLILDTEVRIDKTYSSSKIYADIQQCLEDSKTYTLEELGNFSGASYKIVASTSEMTSKSIIYLIANGNTYDMYIVEIDGTTTKIGDMDIDLSNYYTKTKIDNDFLKKVDADGKYATITTVNDKVNKTDITTTIDSSSTDDKVPSAKAVYNSISSISGVDNLTSLVAITNLNDFKGSSFMIGRGTPKETSHVPNGINEAFVVEFFPYDTGDRYGVQRLTLVQSNDNNYSTFERSLSNNVWRSWKELATINNVERFSTTEIPIGTWIDGKPIYRIYVTFPVFHLKPSEWSTVNSLSITGIDEIINARAKRSEDNAIVPLAVRSRGTSIEVNSFVDFSISKLILEYTKQ